MYTFLRLADTVLKAIYKGSILDVDKVDPVICVSKRTQFRRKSEFSVNLCLRSKLSLKNVKTNYGSFHQKKFRGHSVM